MTAPVESERASAMAELLERARLAQDESAQRAREAWNPEFWRGLNPGLSLGQRTTADTMQRAPPAAAEQDAIVASFHREGWLRVPPVLMPEVTNAMRRGIETLRATGWPEAFAFVYDEFWLAPRLPALTAIITGALGAGYSQLPHVWGHYVPPGARGWTPHVDGSRKDRLTLWIALNEAMLDNSCMYLIPADRVPDEFITTFKKAESHSREDVYKALQNARALPAAPGSALAWHQRVIHWGAPSYRNDAPRISFSQEFIAAGATPKDQELPLLNAAGELPPLALRLQLIATAILAYGRFEPMVTRYKALAEGVLAGAA